MLKSLKVTPPFCAFRVSVPDRVAPPDVVFRNIENPPLVPTTTSGLPSPFRSSLASKSPITKRPVLTSKSTRGSEMNVVALGAVVFRNTEKLLLSLLATIKSGLPSPFRSACVPPSGLNGVLKSVRDPKLGVVALAAVVFSNTDTPGPLPLNSTTSGRPSPFRSASVPPSGLNGVLKSVRDPKLGVVALAAVVFSNTDTPGPFPLNSTTSGRPSPFRSASVPPNGLTSVLKSVRGPKLGVVALAAVVFSNTDTPGPLPLNSTTSGRPSPFRSASVPPSGLNGVLKSVRDPKLGVVALAAVVFSNTDTPGPFPL